MEEQYSPEEPPQIQQDLLENFLEILNSKLPPEGCFRSDLVYYVSETEIEFSFVILVPETSFGKIQESIQKWLTTLPFIQIEFTALKDSLFGFKKIRVTGIYKDKDS
jgi:hypothetical protein